MICRQEGCSSRFLLEPLSARLIAVTTVCTTIQSVTVCRSIALHRAVVPETSVTVCHSIALHRAAVPETDGRPPISVHVGMFVPALDMQCSPSQRDKWFRRAERYEILGTYAQTELGHGNDDV